MLIAELSAVTVHRTSVSEMDNRCYVITSRDTGAQVLVDAAADAPALQALLAEAAVGEPDLRAIVTTHRHLDHWYALADVRAGLGVPAAAGVNDAEGIDAPTDRTLSDGEVLTVGDLTFDVIELVGHTPGSIALLWRGGDDGDQLFGDDGDAMNATAGRIAAIRGSSSRRSSRSTRK